MTSSLGDFSTELIVDCQYQRYQFVFISYLQYQNLPKMMMSSLNVERKLWSTKFNIKPKPSIWCFHVHIGCVTYFKPETEKNILLNTPICTVLLDRFKMFFLFFVLTFEVVICIIVVTSIMVAKLWGLNGYEYMDVWFNRLWIIDSIFGRLLWLIEI